LVVSPSTLEERITTDVWGEVAVYARTLLQNSMTILGDANTVGATNVAGSVWDSLGNADVGCWSQSAQFESAIVEMKHDKSSKRSGDLASVFEANLPC
jgi:hypothetical protein